MESSAMTGRTYIETFDDGPGGWFAWAGPSQNMPLQIEDGVAVSRSPWAVDANHAPPGAGYLHLLYVLPTARLTQIPRETREFSGPNRFVEGGFPIDFTNATITVRIKGKVESRGAKLVLLAQGNVGDRTINYILTGQPLEVTPDWSRQSLTLRPDLREWTCLGARHDMLDFYGWEDIAAVLQNVDVDLIFVFFMPDVVPSPPMDGDHHRLRPQRHYPIDETRLPEGVVMLDEVRIEFPD
jgi:hypothetical protein